MENVNTASASARFVRISVRKMNQVADVVRRKTADDALDILTFVPKKGAKILHKIIRSAVANAEMNHDMSAEDLVVDEIHVEQGPTMKRFRPCPMGRAARIRKRTSHTTVILKEDPTAFEQGPRRTRARKPEAAEATAAQETEATEAKAESVEVKPEAAEAKAAPEKKGTKAKAAPEKKDAKAKAAPEKSGKKKETED